MKWNRIGIAKRLIVSGKFRKAKNLLRPLAEKESQDAQYMLGYLYYGGDPETSRKDANGKSKSIRIWQRPKDEPLDDHILNDF